MGNRRVKASPAVTCTVCSVDRLKGDQGWWTIYTYDPSALLRWRSANYVASRCPDCGPEPETAVAEDISELYLAPAGGA